LPEGLVWLEGTQYLKLTRKYAIIFWKSAKKH
jgi:hypothetical protein